MVANHVSKLTNFHFDDLSVGCCSMLGEKWIAYRVFLGKPEVKGP
jgi:hypothetical protein